MNTASDGRSANRYNIRVLDRAFGVLALLSDGKPRSLQQLSQEMHLSPSTAFRQLASLAQYKYVERDGGTGQYRLGIACLELARAYSEADDLRRIAIPELESLRDETRETVHLAVLDQMEIIYIEKLQGLHAIGLMGSRVGGRAPAYCTGVGKVLLAYQPAGIVKRTFQRRKFHRYTAKTFTTLKALTAELETIQNRGYAIDHGEHEAQVCCVAAPIFNISGQVIAGLSISGPAERMEPMERNRKMIESALLTASHISSRLGYSCP